MRVLDYVALVLRSLRRSKLRSGLTISAILIGSTGITVMLTFVTAVKSEVVNQFVSSGQIDQIQVAQTANLNYNPSGSIEGGNGGQQGTTSPMTAALEAKIAALPHVTGVAATLQSGGYLQYIGYGDHKLSINQISSYEPNGVIKPTLAAGRQLTANDATNAVLLTQDYADALGFKGQYSKLIGQKVALHTSPGYTGSGASLPTTLPPQLNGGSGCHSQNCGPTSGLPAIDLPAAVVGIVKSSYGQQTIYMPNSWSLGITNQARPNNIQYANFNNCQAPCTPQGPGTVEGGWVGSQTVAQEIANQGGYASFIVNVDNTSNIATVAKTINQFGVSTATGLDVLNQQKHITDVIGLILGSLGLVALLIAALGVMNTMVMSVLERTREIGVMRALGAKRSTIRRIFSFEAAGLGFFGGLIGVIIAFTATLIAKPFITKALSSSGSGLAGVSFTVPLWLAIMVIAGTTLIGFLSGLIPARRAARLDPVEALRYE